MLFIFSALYFTDAYNFLKHLPVVHGAMGCGQKSFKFVWWCHQLLSGFSAKGHLSRVSRQSRWLLMIRVIRKWCWGLCTDLLEFSLHLRKTISKIFGWFLYFKYIILFVVSPFPFSSQNLFSNFPGLKSQFYLGLKFQ